VNKLTPECVAREIIRPELREIRMELCGEIIPRMWNNREVFEALERMAGKFANAFARENPAFSRELFMTDCGFNE
jgi:hypothetical protein